MDGADAGLPDAVEAVVAALERAELRQVAEQADGTDGLQVDDAVLDGVDADEPEAGVADLGRAVPGEGDDGVVDRVVLVRRAHRLGDALAEADAGAGRGVVRRRAERDRDAAVEFAAEVEQDAAAVLQRAGRRPGDARLAGSRL